MSSFANICYVTIYTYKINNSLTGYAKMLYEKLYGIEFSVLEYQTHTTEPQYPWRHQIVVRDADLSLPTWYSHQSAASDKIKYFDLTTTGLFQLIYSLYVIMLLCYVLLLYAT